MSPTVLAMYGRTAPSNVPRRFTEAARASEQARRCGWYPRARIEHRVVKLGRDERDRLVPIDPLPLAGAAFADASSVEGDRL